MEQIKEAMRATFKEEKQREVGETLRFFNRFCLNCWNLTLERLRCCVIKRSWLSSTLRRTRIPTGEAFYEDGMFSIQKVDPRPIDLGIYSQF